MLQYQIFYNISWKNLVLFTPQNHVRFPQGQCINPQVILTMISSSKMSNHIYIKSSGPQYMEKQDQNYLPAPFLELPPLEVRDHTIEDKVDLVKPSSDWSLLVSNLNKHKYYDQDPKSFSGKRLRYRQPSHIFQSF